MSDDTPSNSKEKEGKLDLGLSSLLDGAAKELKSSLNEVGSLSEVLKKSVELSQTKDEVNTKEEIKADPPPVISEPIAAPLEKDQFQKLADAGKWSELSKLCEEKLAESKDSDRIAKLWWIKSQFETRAIPISILAPSLNLIAKEILNNPELPEYSKKLCEKLLLEFSKNLISNSDYELVLLFLAYSLEHNKGSNAEISPLIIELEKKIKADSTFQSNEAVEKELQALKSQYKLNLYNSIFDKIEITENTFTRKPLDAEPAKSRTALILLTLVLLSLAVLGFIFRSQITESAGGAIDYAFNIFDSGANGDYQPSLNLAENFSDQTLIEPQPERVAGLNHLDAVFYEVDNAVNTPPSATPAVAITQPVPVRNDSPVAQLPNRSPGELDKIGGPGQKPKDEVNTSYPLERNTNVEKDTEKDAAEEIPEIDFPPYRSNKKPGDSNFGTKDSRTAGTPNYVIIAKTRVMAEPTYWAEVKGDLSIGDKVLVEEPIGKWLRIKAKNGKYGYILSQDADKIY